MNKFLSIALAAFCLATLRPTPSVAANPVCLDVRSHEAFVFPPDSESFAVRDTDLRLPYNEFEKFLDSLDNSPEPRFALLFLRPDSAPFQRKIRKLLRDRGFSLQFEPLEGDEPFPDIVPAYTEGYEVGNKAPVYFECRASGLFAISLAEFKITFDDKTEQLLEESNGDEAEFLKRAANTILHFEGLRMDYAMAMTGRFTLFPVLEATGHPADGSWFEEQLAAFDPSKHFVCFFLRPDGIRVFRQARDAAWDNGFEVTVELQQAREPIDIGDPSSQRVMP